MSERTSEPGSPAEPPGTAPVEEGEEGARSVRDHLARSGIEHEIVPCDPELADTAAFCAAYGYSPEDSANTILVVGKSDPPRYAACVVLATTRLDVNRTVRARLGVKKASFADPGADQGDHRDAHRRRDRARAPGGSADLGRLPGRRAAADRARRREPELQGRRTARAPDRPGGGRGREPVWLWTSRDRRNEERRLAEP